VALATEVSAIAANLAAPPRANGSDAQQTSVTSRQNRAGRPTAAANEHTGRAGHASA